MLHPRARIKEIGIDYEPVIGGDDDNDEVEIVVNVRCSRILTPSIVAALTIAVENKLPTFHLEDDTQVGPPAYDPDLEPR